MAEQFKKGSPAEDQSYGSPPKTCEDLRFATTRKQGIKFLCIASAAVGFSLTLQIALNANFAVEEMNLSGFQQGLLEMFRESCGIFALGILALLAGLAEPLIGAAVLVFLAVGLGSYCYVHNYFWLVIASLVWSQGLHIWMPLPNSMGLALAEPGCAGRRIGQIQAAGAAGSGLGLVCALVLNIAGVRDSAFIYCGRLGGTYRLSSMSVYPAPNPNRKTQTDNQTRVRSLLSAQFSRRLA